MAIPIAMPTPLTVPAYSQKTGPITTVISLPPSPSSVSSHDSMVLEEEETASLPIDIPSTLSLATQLREAQAVIARLQHYFSQEMQAHDRTKQALEDVEERNEQLKAHFMHGDFERDDERVLRAETLAMGYRVVRAEMTRESAERERDEAIRGRWALEGKVRGLEETERGLRREVLGLEYKLKLERGANMI